MKQITPQEADALTRASWPRPYAETLPIDYSLHTSECGTVGSEEDECKPPRRWVLLAVGACVLLGYVWWLS